MLAFVAAVSGTVAGVVDSARAGKGPVLRTPASVERPAKRCPLPARFRPYFEAAAEDADVPMSMLVAVALVESQLDPLARSASGAHGLLQVLPETAAQLDLDAYRVRENVLAGARYLRQMLDRFQSADLALAAYNAGPTAVERKGAAPNDETVAYVANVTREWRRIVGCS